MTLNNKPRPTDARADWNPEGIRYLVSGSGGCYCLVEAGVWDAHIDNTDLIGKPGFRRSYSVRWAGTSPWRRLKLWLWYNDWINQLVLYDPDMPDLPIVWFRRAGSKE